VVAVEVVVDHQIVTLEQLVVMVVAAVDEEVEQVEQEILLH